MRVLYLGTPQLATIPLRAMAAMPSIEIVGVVTQPDRPSGRGRVLTPPPVKLCAQELGIGTILQPETLKDDAVVAQIAALRPDIGVVAAYGEILRRNMLTIPPHGYLNIHPSLLPLHRGPAPVTSAILAGDREVGVSVMQLGAKMDAGPILRQHRQPMRATDRAGALTDELFHIGAQMLCDVIAAYVTGTLVPTPQDDSRASYIGLLSRDVGVIDWTASATTIDRMVRLAGVDAPERGLSCNDASGRWFDCGAAAAEALSRLVNNRSVVCLVAGRDRFGRGLAQCSAGGAELNAGLVASGWALAMADQPALAALEAEARRGARGLWAGGFTRPEEWRRRN